MYRTCTLLCAALILGGTTLIVPEVMADETVTVMNPRGMRPAIRLVPMAERPETLAGKTVYIVDTKFPRTKPFVEALQRNLAQRHPETEWVIKEKRGSYLEDDPALWEDAAANAAGAIVLTGH